MTEAVSVIDGTFSYGRSKTKALDGVNLYLPRGLIYALIGPSGCGKTALISCLASVQTLNKGSIRIFGTRPGSRKSGVPGPWIGLMPQELSLYSELTIGQTLMYFGRLHLLKKTKLTSRVTFLVDFLQLPHLDVLLCNLSVGQQRRLSLGVALISKPPLLLLDEPTISLDPTLSNTIWSHLLHLSKTEFMTILLTTHYIEEARKANLVGMMRDGQILIERNPERLLKQYKATTLEQVFLTFCLKEPTQNIIRKYRRILDDTPDSKDSCNYSHWSSPGNNIEYQDRCPLMLGQHETESIELEDLSTPKGKGANGLLSNTTGNVDLPSVHRSFKDHYQIISTLTVKSLQRFRKNLFFLFLVIWMPCVIIVLLKLVMGQDLKGLHIGVINQEQPPEESQHFLKNVDQDVLLQVSLDSKEEAVKIIGEKLTGILSIRQNFTKNIAKRLIHGLSAENETILGSFVYLQMATANPLVTTTVYNSMMNAYKQTVADVTERLNASRNSTTSALKFMEPVVGSINPTHTEFITPSWICGVLYMTGLSCSCLAILEEFNRGALNINRAAGVSTTQIILSHLILQYSITLFHVISLTVYIYVFGMTGSDSGSPILVAYILLQQTTVGIAQGIFLSTFVKTMLGALMTLYVVQCFDGVLAGQLWPIESSPHWIRYLSLTLSPTASNSQVLRLLLNRNLGLLHTSVWFSFLVSFFWIIVFSLGSTVTLSYRQ